jgi:ISXO2-like transposase domain/Transposase zinc-ribbon domain
MPDYPRSLIEFQRRFPHDEACAAYLTELRWPDGFRCPACGHDRAWALRTKPWTHECRGCRRQTSVRAGTIMHASKLPLTVWFWAAYLMATHSNGISALQLQKQLAIGSYKSAWLLAAKLRAAMVAPERNPLKGLVEVDETSIHHRTRNDPPAGGRGRSHEGKLLIAGAVEVDISGPGRIRLAAIDDYSADTLQGFVTAEIAAGSVLKTDGWPAYGGVPDMVHLPHVIGADAAHDVLPWIHRVFSNFKTWALGVYHGLRAKHLKTYLDEFVFRFNRRRTRHAGFRSLLNIVTKSPPLTYKMLTEPEATA